MAACSHCFMLLVTTYRKLIRYGTQRPFGNTFYWRISELESPKTSCFVRLADFAVKFVLGPYNHYRVALYCFQILTNNFFSCFIISSKACTPSSSERMGFRGRNEQSSIYHGLCQGYSYCNPADHPTLLGML